MRRHDMKLDMILRGIVMTRGENGATIDEMRNDYFDIFSEPWPLKTLRTEQIVAYLLHIDGLMMEKLNSGLCIWYIDDIGSNISERDLDSNNNVVAPTEVSSVAMENLTEENVANNEPRNHSYAIPAPRVPRRMVTSSFVNEHVTGVSSASSDGLIFMESIENGNEKAPQKRHLSQNSETESPKKRIKTVEANRLPLIEKNLYIHDRHNGANEMLKQATSTEKENSILVQNEPNGCIEAIDGNDYIPPINEPDTKQLPKLFTKRCQINEKPKIVPPQSVDSTISMGEELFPPAFALVADDFMRSLISFELYGSDFTSQNDKRFGYCIPGQTVRQAYYLVLDKQNQFASNYRHIIVNIGAIDILAGRDLIDTEAAYVRLVRAIDVIGCQPIITTIPELFISPNNPNAKIIRQTLLLFNRFLIETFGDAYPVVDLYTSLPKMKNNLNPNYYYHQQPKSISVGERILQLWHWSDVGRKKILNAMDTCIEKCTRQ